MMCDVGQAEGIRQWWAEADSVTRGRALRLREDDFLPADMQVDLAMAGVTVSPVGYGWDGAPQGYWVSPILWDFLRARDREG